ncbi:hypothetical protein [Hansschlegelia sp. KR7-227]|uniref:hypothetical protein n=1 Tax=Hansschlegelia sp. KR7-227 TaxID=3400914 RepID=UPI003C0413AD
MDVSTTARSTRAWRFCVRVAVALCLVAFGVGDAVERSFGAHATLDTALSHAISADQSAGVSTDHSGIHVDGPSGDVDMSSQIVGHGCHGCAALPEPMLQIAAAPSALGSPPAWASVPSTAGREPLIDLPPPRA